MAGLSAVFAFAQPWALGLLILLPGLWWLLKSLPPTPRRLSFPPIRLLSGLNAQRPTPARMPLWLLVLRLMLAGILILGLAHPVLNPAPADQPTAKPLLLVIDNGWAAASDWGNRQAWADARLAAAGQADRAVMILFTAPQAGEQPGGQVWGGQAPELVGPMTAAAARAAMAAAQPHPWSTDRGRALETLRAQPNLSAVDVEWLCDGVEDGSGQTFFRALTALDPGVLTFLGRTTDVLVRDQDADDDPTQLHFDVSRPRPDPAESSALPPTVRAVDGNGLVLSHTAIAATGDAKASVVLPTELRNRIERVDLGTQSGAAGVWLSDEGAKRRAVGIVEGGAEHAQQPLLEATTYIAKALKPAADIHAGAAADLIAAKPSIIFTGDWTPGGVLDALKPWVQHGGMVVRFGGPGLTETAFTDEPQNALLPVPVMRGGRALGGQMSWTTPQRMAPFDDNSPFAGLPIPDDVTVTTQILADPDGLSPNGLSHAQIWAKLADGTPLVTAKPYGRGWIVLFHVTATPDWSNLPLSGLFPAMMQRLVAFSHGTALTSTKPLPPYKILDGLGHLTTPGVLAQPASPTTPVGPNHPPGLYGDAAAYVAVNLGPAVRGATALDTSIIPQLRPLQITRPPVDLTPAFILAAVVLMLIDLTLRLWPRPVLAAMLCMIALLPPAMAQQVESQAALEPRLGYVVTGAGPTDAASNAGLGQLSALLANRSTVVLAPPKGLDLDTATLVFYPLIYWPVLTDQPPLTANAIAKVRQYLSHGGMILFDGQPGSAASLRRLGDSLDLPQLTPLPSDHVLTRSFYLINATALGANGDPLWIEANSADNDGVASVLVTTGQWASLWAQGPNSQTEPAFRFGVNLCLYALTGNYKADQIHMQAILRRLGAPEPPNEGQPSEDQP